VSTLIQTDEPSVITAVKRSAPPTVPRGAAVVNFLEDSDSNDDNIPCLWGFHPVDLIVPPDLTCDSVITQPPAEPSRLHLDLTTTPFIDSTTIPPVETERPVPCQSPRPSPPHPTTSDPRAVHLTTSGPSAAHVTAPGPSAVHLTISGPRAAHSTPLGPSADPLITSGPCATHFTTSDPRVAQPINPAPVPTLPLPPPTSTIAHGFLLPLPPHITAAHRLSLLHPILKLTLLLFSLKFIRLFLVVIMTWLGQTKMA